MKITPDISSLLRRVLCFSHDKIDKTYILQEDIDFKHLWLLEEGHCMRDQMMRICELRNLENTKIKYNAGSIESLINITESMGGMTIIPELATWNLSPERKKGSFHLLSQHPYGK